jgi:DNA polymerase III delta subunit
MKHLNLIYYGLKEQVEAGKISSRFVRTADIPADILIKALTRGQVEKAVSMLALHV